MNTQPCRSSETDKEKIGGFEINRSRPRTKDLLQTQCVSATVEPELIEYSYKQLRNPETCRNIITFLQMLSGSVRTSSSEDLPRV